MTGLSEEEKKEYEELKSLLYTGQISQYGKRKLIDIIEKQDTEINKLNNVIDKMAKCINAADVNREENVDICKDKGNCIDDCLECKDCIKEYFMKEDK